jgi:hypothetical protein
MVQNLNNLPMANSPNFQQVNSPNASAPTNSPNASAPTNSPNASPSIMDDIAVIDTNGRLVYI